MGSWTVAEAKSRFSEVVDRARSEGPQRVTRYGRPAAVIVSSEEWERRTARRGSLHDFLASSPLRGSGIDLTRVPDPGRKVEL